jgi:Ni/Co efflux regulator RcnB
MKKLLVVLAVFASVTVTSAQTKPAQKKESCEIKKEDCAKKGDKPSCCSPGSKAKTVSTAKKAPAGA